MNLSTNPSVWRVALGTVVAAGVSAGIIGPELGERINAGLGALLIAVTALLPVIGAIWSKGSTAPVAAGTPAVKYLERGEDGVYHEFGGDPRRGLTAEERAVPPFLPGRGGPAPA